MVFTDVDERSMSQITLRHPSGSTLKSRYTILWLWSCDSQIQHIINIF